MEEADLIVETPKDTKNAAIIHPKWKKTGQPPYRQRYEEFLENFQRYQDNKECWRSDIVQVFLLLVSLSVMSVFSFSLSFIRNQKNKWH